MGCSVPNIYFIAKPVDKQNVDISTPVELRVLAHNLKEFEGLGEVDDQTKRALLTFSFQLACGNLDEAYRAVKAIRNSTVWENMAQMCVKAGRLDVAEVCLGNMRFSRGAKAVREAKENYDEVEAQLAAVAIQLNMFEEARNLYISCGRYDLLNKMYQACGEWEEALKIAEKHDRVHLKTTY